jgi:DNA-binding IclR family transcriptional regulator
VKRVLRESWACSNQEYVLGVVGCAVPIRDTAGRLIAGLGISAPSARFPFDQLGRYRKVMESAAAEVAEALSSED